MPLLSRRFSSPAHSPSTPVPIRFGCVCRLDHRGFVALELSGELDRAGCRLFAHHLGEAQRASGHVTLDLDRLTFMDSAGYAVLVEAARFSRPEARFVLVGCSGQVNRLLDLVGLPGKIEMDSSISARRPDAAAGMAGQREEAAVGA